MDLGAEARVRERLGCCPLALKEKDGAVSPGKWAAGEATGPSAPGAPTKECTPFDTSPVRPVLDLWPPGLLR